MSEDRTDLLTFTVKKVVLSFGHAQSEVERLNKLNKRCRYEWQYTRLEIDLPVDYHEPKLRSPAMSEHIQAIGDRIAALTRSEAGELLGYLDETHGIRPPDSQVLAKEPPPPQEKPPEQTEFDVILDGHEPSQKITVIKLYREVSGAGLRESKEFVETGSGNPIKSGVSRQEAEALKAKMEAGGAKISIR